MCYDDVDKTAGRELESLRTENEELKKKNKDLQHDLDILIPWCREVYTLIDQFED